MSAKARNDKSHWGLDKVSTKAYIIGSDIAFEKDDWSAQYNLY